MKSWQTGAKREKEIVTLLDDAGWWTRRFTKVQYSSQDVFGVDIIAKKKGYTMWIQVKSNANQVPWFDPDTKAELTKLAKACCQHEMVVWMGYNGKAKEWTCWTYDETMWRQIVLEAVVSFAS